MTSTTVETTQQVHNAWRRAGMHVDSVDPHYLHLGGPTLAEWQAQQEYVEAMRETRELYAWAMGR